MPDPEREDASNDKLREAERRRIEADTNALMAFWNDHEARFGSPADEYCEI
jgi:antitoxin CcdA